MATLPRYPIYVPSKGRADCCLTARFLTEDGCPFHLVVEPQDEAKYRAAFPQASVLVLPWNDPGSVIPARNWIKEHATAEGHERHWQIDDNCQRIRRWVQGKRIPCRAGIALAAVEDFTDRYENVAVAGLNYTMFQVTGVGHTIPAFFLNHRVYSCTLTLNSTPHEWRGRYNEDTDYCLQVLADGWCTILVNAFCIDKIRTMTMKGGNTDALYHGDGRLEMARELERRWPGVVTVTRKWGRPQHVVNWSKFDTPLRRRADFDFDALPKTDEYGMVLTRVKPEARP